MSARVRLEVWCEDRSHEQFVRRVFALPGYGLTYRDIRAYVAPKGTGAASQWVIDNAAAALRRARAERHQTRLGFLMVVDGDVKGVYERKKSILPSDLARQEVRFAIWVPTRNIESWVMFLGADEAPSDFSEESDYKLLVQKDWPVRLSAAAAHWRTNSTRGDSPASLADAYEEMRFLPFDAR